MAGGCVFGDCEEQLTPLNRLLANSRPTVTVKQPQPGPPEDFHPIRNQSLNKEMNMRTSRETALSLDWLLSIPNFRCLKWLTLSVSQSKTEEFWHFMSSIS